MKICKCDQYCLDNVCISSDSNLTVRKCWCADCAERRNEIKVNAYKLVVTK